MFLDQTTFELTIDKIVQNTQHSYIEAIIEFCDENDLDPGDIKKLFSSNLKDKVKLEAIEQGIMKQESQLPL